MKTMKTMNVAAIVIIAICTACLWACEGNPDLTTVITGTTDNVVFINNGLSPVTLPKNTVVFGGLINTPAGTIGNRVTTSFGVKSTRPAAETIRVTLEVDKSDVPDGYSPLPGGVGLTVDNPALTIPAGASSSQDSITVTLDEDLQALGTGQYAFAIKIASASGAPVSSNLAVAYVVLTTTYTNIQQGATSVSGSTLTKPTGAASWTVTGITTNPQYMLDASTSNSQYAATGAITAYPKEIVVDMKTEYTINGFLTRTTSTSYCPTAGTIYTRLTETDDWTLQGSLTWTRSTIQYVRFYAPVAARYVRIDITAVYSANYGARYTDFTIYQ